jgi:hypothetical protein
MELVDMRLHHKNGYDHFWKVMRSLNKQGEWSAVDVFDQSNCRKSVIDTYVIKLEKAGVIVSVGERPGKHAHMRQKLFRIEKNQLETPRISDDGKLLGRPTNDLLWIVMRIQKTFTLQSLINDCQFRGREISLRAARRYVDMLAMVGIVSKLDKKPKTKSNYRLHNYVGPKAPQIIQCNAVFDPNAGEIVGGIDAEVFA